MTVHQEIHLLLVEDSITCMVPAIREIAKDGKIGGGCCDPPYGLEFMSKDWDRLDPQADEAGEEEGQKGEPRTHAEKMQAQQEWHAQWLKGVFQLLRPGGLLKVFGGTRTFHRLAAAMEEVGFVLDPAHSLEAWAYGSGFPKSLNVAKAIDKHLRPKPEEAEEQETEEDEAEEEPTPAELTSPEAVRFSGYGTALKPAWEPFLVGRKPE